MKLIVEEKDFEDVLGKGEVTARFRQPREHLAEEEKAVEHQVFDNLPKIIAEKFRQVVPDTFSLDKVEMEFDVSGKPFGIGIGGKVIVSFSPKPPTN